MFLTFEPLHDKIVHCHRCPRLVAFRESVPIRASLVQEEKSWRKPLPGFGDENAWLLILGLAPSAGGGNRTGRIFTGDESGRFLMNALYKTSFANQPASLHRKDGLTLTGCYLTAAVKCVPPKNRPLPEEFCNCSGYLDNEIFLLKNLRAILALGKLSFDAYQNFLIRQKIIRKRSAFSHGAKLSVPGWPHLYGSYHPSPQNTYTGKLTEEMLVSLLSMIRAENDTF